MFKVKDQSTFPCTRTHRLMFCFSLVGFLILGLVQASAQVQAPYLNKGDGLPPFFASMEKHEVMVQVQIRTKGQPLLAAPKDLRVGFRILAQGQKVRDYKEKTDAQGRAYFLGIPSNPKVQGMISYEAWVDYQGVRFPFNVKGIPKTEDKEALYDDFNPSQRLPENRLNLVVSPAVSDISALALHHDLIELHPDEESLLAIHEMTLSNSSDQVIDLSHQPQGGLKLPAPDGAKAPELHQSHHDEVEVRGTALYYTGALLPHSTKKIKWYYTLPYRAERFDWNQSMPLPSTVGMIVAPQYKKPQHQSLIKLQLEASPNQGEVKQVSTGPGRVFDALRKVPTLQANTALKFAVTGIPAAPQWKRKVLYASIAFVLLWVFWLGFGSDEQASSLSRSHLLIEQERLLKALARMEAALERGKMTQARYQKEREVITARLVTIYRALEHLEQQASAAS